MWYVRASNKIIGWVIAANEKEALQYAYIKFPTWDFEPYEVEPRKRK